MRDQEQTTAYVSGQIKTTKHLSLPWPTAIKALFGTTLYQAQNKIYHTFGLIAMVALKKKKQPAEDLKELDDNGNPKILSESWVVKISMVDGIWLFLASVLITP